MKFPELEYARPDFDKFKSEFLKLVEAFKTTGAKTASVSKTDAVSELKKLFEAIYEMRRTFDTAMTLVSIRNSIDTTNEFYEKEQEYFDENEPMYRDIVMQFYKALIESPMRVELEKLYGAQLFMLAELSIKTFSTEIIDATFWPSLIT